MLAAGCSRGIGKSIALAFAAAGADVVIASRKLPDLEKVTAKIKRMGRKVLCIPTHAKKNEDLICPPVLSKRVSAKPSGATRN
ncbi:MAG: SDR family NAD(P)-dependent oxidoreductase [Proteobacteria bacterium]|nr:SDR family NAD(P)-dependent oxidoreductase [Pseudomonadota bacterium]